MEVPLAAEKIGNIGDFGVTNSLLMMWLAISTLLIIAIVGTSKINKIPGRLQNILEIVIEAADKMMRDIAGKRSRIFLPLVLTFFLLILTTNWLGLLPGVAAIGFWEMHDGHKVFVPLFRPGNSDLNITLGLGLISVFTTQYFGLKFKGLLGYFKHYFHNPLTGGIVFVAAGVAIGAFVGILELVSEFVKIVSLSFRLFGNIFAGEAVLMTVSGISKYLAPVPFMMLETLVGVVQAAVFALLTLVFISIITAEPHSEGQAH